MRAPPTDDPGLDSLVTLTLETLTEVHRRLGPGLPRPAYLRALELELTHRGAMHQRAVNLPIFYRGVRLDAAYVVDVCVAGAVAVDVRTLPGLVPVHRTELRARLRASGLPAGVVVNFHAPRLGEGLVVVRRTCREARAHPVEQLALLEQPTQVGPAPRAA